MKILVLFDGAGLARLGLEQAGHECIGIELCKIKHHLSSIVGSGYAQLGDATKANFAGYDATWASPPCARRSTAIKDLTGNNGLRNPEFQNDYLPWCLANIKTDISWIENVTLQGSKGNDWGIAWNAAQFINPPLQNRNRIIGGKYKQPRVWHSYKRWFPGLCPTISATEYKGCASDRLRASRFYGRKLTLEECAYHQGFKIPSEWYRIPDWYLPKYRHREIQWERRLYEAIGDGVPVYMSKAFGLAVI